jgi:hypothetical protein
MRLLRVVGILVLCLYAMTLVATAGQNNFGVSDVAHVQFAAPVRVGAALLPAGKYTVRHTMEGQEHVMVFQLTGSKGSEVKAKCTLIQLAKKADQTSTVYEVNASKERILRELVFRGDTAKHVF